MTRTIRPNGRNYHACRAGWLLACDAPENIDKGLKLFNRLAPSSRIVAWLYREQCLAVYERGTTVLPVPLYERGKEHLRAW